ncbi:unnamed protein product [Rhizoctonia solani]|uniref:Ricin B lectin domain-containing protein n=1 Tax=Rhizoctonia solani TaxID=456999 RepID=A0A8H3HXG4_9AGAM|nr:unnamed protein product [Rhizoctonia solani]
MTGISLPAGTYILQNAATNSLLDLWNSESTEGSVIQGHQPNGGNNQKWVLAWTGIGNSVTLRNVASGTYIGKGSTGVVEGSPVLGSSTPERLLLVAVDKGFAIEATDNRAYVLDLAQNSSANRVPAVYRNNNANDTQKWYFVKQD